MKVVEALGEEVEVKYINIAGTVWVGDHGRNVLNICGARKIELVELTWK